MRCLALLPLIALCAAPAFAGPPAGRYCAHEVLGGAAEDKLDIILDLQARGSATYVSLRSAVTAAGGQVIAAGPLLSSPMPGGAISFTFADGHGGSGEGTMSGSGLLSLQALRMTVVQPSQELARNYGVFRVTQAACSEEDKAIKIGR